MEQQMTCVTVDAATYAEALEELEAHREDSVSFLQSPLYAAVQAMTGKNVVRVVAREHEHVAACAIGIVYEGPFGLSFLYVPYGPIVAAWTDALFLTIKRCLMTEAKRLGCSFVRVDDFPGDLAKHSLTNKRARAASLQPRAEWVVDLSPPEEKLWADMHKHARYNVRLAERAQATTHIFAPADAPIDVFYALMQTTGDRDGFSIFDKAYYQSYLACLDVSSGFVVMCYIDGKPAAAGLFVIHDKQTHYVFAGSSDDFRKIAPAYTVIWEAMKTAKQSGCTLFNFGGITDDVKGQAWGGVTSFKKRFGGYAVTHLNPIDVVVKKFRYCLFSLYKKLR